MKRLIVIALVLISSCKQTEKKEAEEEIISADSNSVARETDYTIISYTSDYYWIFENATSSDLSEVEIAKLEKIIETAVKKSNDRQKRFLEKQNKNYPNNQREKTGFELQLEKYKRQYIPIINSKGEKEVWCNFFCEDFEFAKWRTEIPIVLDGGNCFFNLKVNLTTGAFKDLQINSIARNTIA